MSTEPTPAERYAALQTALARYEASGNPHGPWTSLSIDAQNELIQTVLDESQTNGAVIDRAIAAGPLGTEELLRRAQVSFFNHMAEVYDESAILARNVALHPETRQVAARTAEIAMEVARSLDPTGYKLAVITRSELERLKNVVFKAFRDAEAHHKGQGSEFPFQQTDEGQEIAAMQALVQTWIEASS